MTDELERIRVEAAERRENRDHGRMTALDAEDEAEKALDRAIAIAEENILTLERHAFNVGSGVAEYQQMRADVVKLRQFIADDYEYAEHDKNQNPVTLVVDVHAEDCSYCRAKDLLADTDREQHRSPK